MQELNIIFWVCVVEAWIGHMPWTAPLLVFCVSVVASLFVTKAKKERDKTLKELEELLRKLQEKK